MIFNLAEKYGIRIRIAREFEKWIFGAGDLTVFPPVRNFGTNRGENERGLSVMAAVNDVELLITGDMNAASERRLIAEYDFPDLEIIIAGHHGSKYSSCDEFLSRLRPEIACVSVGDNSYGHPAPETLERLESHGCEVYRTDKNGDIFLVMG